MKKKLYKDASNEWRWTLIADNGEIVADSAESYKNKVDAETELNKVLEASKESTENTM